MSSMRSASSSTKTSTWSSMTARCCIRSSSRPGVATKTSTPLRERADLRIDVHAADGERHARAEVAAVGPEAVDDLRGQLAGRAQHQHAAGSCGRRVAVVREVIEDRQREGGGLAGAGLRDADDIAAGEHCGMVWAWIGVGVGYCSSARALVMGSARPRSRKAVNCEIFLMTRPAGAPIGAVSASSARSRSSRGSWTPRVVWDVDERVGGEGSKTKTWNSFTRPVCGLMRPNRSQRRSHSDLMRSIQGNNRS